MAYDKYSTEVVFFDENLNVLCNALYEFLGTVDPWNVTQLALSGVPARIVNGDTSFSSFRCIPFITANQALYDALNDIIKQVWPVATRLVFKDRIQVVIYEVYFEFWISDSAILTLDKNGIITQDSDQIPTNLL